MGLPWSALSLWLSGSIKPYTQKCIIKALFARLRQATRQRDGVAILPGRSQYTGDEVRLGTKTPHTAKDKEIGACNRSRQAVQLGLVACNLMMQAAYLCFEICLILAWLVQSLIPSPWRQCENSLSSMQEGEAGAGGARLSSSRLRMICVSFAACRIEDYIMCCL